MKEYILSVSCHAYQDYCVTCTGFPVQINQGNVTLTCSEMKRKKQGNQHRQTRVCEIQGGSGITSRIHPNREECFLCKRSLLVILFQNIYLTCLLFPFCAREFKVSEDWENYKYTTATDTWKSLLFRRSSSLLKGWDGGPIIPQV